MIRIEDWAAAALVVAMLGGCMVETVPNDKMNLQEAARTRSALAMKYLQDGDIEKAQAQLQKALDSDPDSVEAYTGLGLVYEQEGDARKAEKNYRKALRLNSDNPQTHNNYGVFLFKQGRYEDACEHLALAAQNINYDHRDSAFENLGRCYVQRNDKDKAEQAFMRALRMNDSLVIADLEYSALLFDKGEYEKAHQGYQHFLVLNKDNPQSAKSLWLGIRLERIFGNKNALASYELALKRLYPASDEYHQYQQSLVGAVAP